MGERFKTSRERRLEGWSTDGRSGHRQTIVGNSRTGPPPVRSPNADIADTEEGLLPTHSGWVWVYASS
jgi:hypothetical protein